MADASSQPELLLKLCNILGNNNPTLCANLYKEAFKHLYLCSSSTGYDENWIVSKMKTIIRDQFPEQLDHFETIYATITKSNVLRDRPAILSFLLHVSELCVDAQVLALSKHVDIAFRKPSTVSFSRVKSTTSQDSIKNLFLMPRCSSTSTANMTDMSSTTAPRLLYNLPSNSSVRSTHLPTFRLNDIPLVVGQRELLQEVIYSLHSIEGKYIKKENNGLGFIIDPKQSRNLTPIQQGLVDRILGLSFLHNQLKVFCDTNDNQIGIIGQALISALRVELSDYYKTVAILQSTIDKVNAMGQSEITLRKVLIYLHDHRLRFEWLAYIAEQCTELKGGALITAVYRFLQHGSKCARNIAERVLSAVCKPWLIMLSRWLLDGVISDPHDEFLIDARPTKEGKLWYEKYFVRMAMLPTFVSLEHANKILASGKSINFLKEICNDDAQLPTALQDSLHTIRPESLFAIEESFEFHSLIEKIYKETSFRVLDLLKNKYRLLKHLQSLRRYLLLGQGDFIRHLIELVAPELDKPAEQVYHHTLSAILESAISVTNAQFEEEDTLKRINVNMMGHSQGDDGWDTFNLLYVIDGPIFTIFENTLPIYQSLFGVLWKAKRMEFVLANMRKQQISVAKRFRYLAELAPVMHRIHIVTSEMIHFIHQTQYYFLFEVLECSWAEMLRHVNNSECLDDIIVAHSNFLSSVKNGLFLEQDYIYLQSSLRPLYNYILGLQSLQNSLCVAADQVHEAILDIDDGDMDVERYRNREEERMKCVQLLIQSKKQVSLLSEQYSEFVRGYLQRLATSANMKLQLLAVRLNFNDFYTNSIM